MAPTATVAQNFNQRRLRSSSLATPKKKVLTTEDNSNSAPATEVKKKRPSRANAKVTDATKALLRGVSPSPLKKRTPASPLKNSPLKNSPLKNLPLNSPVKNSPIKASPLKKSPLKSIQLNSPNVKSVKAKLFEDSPGKKGSLFRADLTRLAQARAALSTSQPNEVIGREKQTKELREFLENNLKIKKGKGSSKKIVKRSIYVSGPPGTGKTTCLKRLLDEIPNLDSKVRTVFVNCMTLGRSGGIFGKVADALCPRKTYSNTNEAQRILEEEAVKSKETILLVLDEIDQLDSKSQEVLYTLFELPYLNNSKLILVGIANALDLTDRILPRLKLRECFCPAELTFAAYSKSEIESILKARVAPFTENTEKPLFQTVALKFLAGKISAVTGDVRKALDVCRRALELAEIEARKQTVLTVGGSPSTNFIKPIGVPQILKIFNEVYGSKVTTSISNDDLPLQQKLLIASLLLMSNHRTNKEITLGKLHETYAKVCKKRGMKHVDLTEAASLCGLLESRGVLAVKHGGPWASSTKDRRVNLRIDEGEVEAALKDKTLLCGILNDVDSIAK